MGNGQIPPTDASVHHFPFLVPGWCVAEIVFEKDFYDIVFSDNVPEIHAMYGDMKNAYNRTDAHLSKGDFNEHRGWVALQPALQILDDICPQASKWAREQHESGKLVWLNQSEDSYAKYSHIHRNLMINVDLFTLTNGERACTIAHEFRHSKLKKM